jgi:predicted nuclease of predicted toxin-antitoxin system
LKLLFDANLSPKLVNRLAELFPDSVHVFDTDLARFTSDEVIWEYAAAKGFTIVTADSDFLDLARSRGVPPKVVRLENCNYRTSQVEELLRRHAILIAELDQSSRAYARHSKPILNLMTNLHLYM